MRYAIAMEDGAVAQHFGRCERYTIADIDDGREHGRSNLDNPGHAPGLLPRLLSQHDVDCVVAGGAGPRAVNLFNELGMDVLLGVSGPVDEVISEIATGDIEPGESTCEH